jgi:surface polysaccharide O-acyltransferase-like enzyme
VNVLGLIRFSVMWHRDHGVPNHQEYVMELVIVTLSIGTLILLATHMVDYAVETTLGRSSGWYTPHDGSGDLPLSFEGAVQ